MSIDLKLLGSMFKGKREEMHLTLKEIENATSIRMVYLQAIEEGSVEKYLSAVYALGFIKQYASFLGLDAEKIIKENPESFKLSAPVSEFEYGIGTLDVRSPKDSTFKWRANIKWGIIVLGSFFLIFLLAKAFNIF